MSEIKCYNKDEHGKCAAFTNPHCHKNCFARQTNLEEYILLLNDLIRVNNINGQSRVRASLKRQLAQAEQYAMKEKSQKFKDWFKVYLEDRHRGAGGGSSEQDSNNAASIKQKMKDNRPTECKMTQQEKLDLKEATDKWEEENGKLPKLARFGMSRGKVDSYTGEEID